MKEKNYCFAYGSNLNEGDLHAWCGKRSLPYPFAGPAKIGYLPDREVVFDYETGCRGGGALALRERRGQAVPGVLFKVAPGGWETLDTKEGAGYCYRRVEATVLLPDGAQVEAVTYDVLPERREGRFVPPTEDYVGIVREGLLSHGLPAAMLEAAATGDEVPFLIPYLFTYGTLLKGECRHGVLEEDGNLLHLEKAAVPGRLYDLGDYPGMTEGAEGEVVTGELCRLRGQEAVLCRLDRIEGFHGFGAEGSLFRRAILAAVTKEGEDRPAWTYIFEGQREGSVVEGGFWPDREQSTTCTSR